MGVLRKVTLLLAISTVLVSIWIAAVVRSGPFAPLPCAVLGVQCPSYRVDGSVRPAFSELRDAFEANFAAHKELHAQFVVYVDDEVVVDLWGSMEGAPGPLVKDAPPAYHGDSMQVVFSSSKVLAENAAFLWLLDRGHVALDDPIVKHWPEFGAHGKAGVRIRDVLMHQAGVDLPDRQPGAATTLDPMALRNASVEPIAAIMAHTKPFYPSDPSFAGRYGATKRAYHGVTRGHVLCEIARRADPQGRHVGQIMEQEYAVPLGVAGSIVLGVDGEDKETTQRLFHMQQWPTAAVLFNLVLPCQLASDPDSFVAKWFGHFDAHFCTMLAEMSTPSSMVSRLMHPRQATYDPSFGTPGTHEPFNKLALLRAEWSSAHVVASARAAAAVLNAIVRGDARVFGSRGRETLVSKALHRSPDARAFDATLLADTVFTDGGFACMSASAAYAAPEEGKPCVWYGWGGWGGSRVFINPEKNVTMVYAMTGMDPYLADASRGDGLAETLAAIVDKL